MVQLPLSAGDLVQAVVVDMVGDALRVTITESGDGDFLRGVITGHLESLNSFVRESVDALTPQAVDALAQAKEMGITPDQAGAIQVMGMPMPPGMDDRGVDDIPHGNYL